MFSIEYIVLFFFFFQAEDGIRDKLVTGVQTCALPISRQAAGKGKGSHPCPRRPGRRTSPTADGADRQTLCVRGPGRQGVSARSVRWPPPAPPLPFHVRSRCQRLADGRLPRLLFFRRPA